MEESNCYDDIANKFIHDASSILAVTVRAMRRLDMKDTKIEAGV